jgi:tetratricopeptide (TPR) repeat protein
LRASFPDITAGQPEVVARHHTEAGLSDAAIDWWSKAGELALRRSAFGEAVAHFHKAIDLADRLAESPKHRLRRLRLQTVYAQALVHARGQGVPETNAAFALARELASGVDDPAERFPAYYGLWTGAYNRADLVSMRELAQHFLRDAERWPGSPEAGIANRVCGITCWFEGDFLRARQHLASALANYEHERDRHMFAAYAWDPGIPAMFYFALVVWALGDVRRAVDQIEEAVCIAAKGGHVPTLAYAHVCAAVFAAICRNPGQVALHAETVLTLARKHVLPQFVAFGTSLLGCAHWYNGSSDGEREMREGLALLCAGGIRTFETLFGILLAELESSAGQIEASFATLNAQLALIEQTGQRSFVADAHRVRGKLMLNSLDVVAAEEAFMKSIMISRNQQTQMFELRASMSMARLWRDQGKRNEARELLAPVYGWFTEGFDTRDLKEAKALLDELHELN